MAAADSGGRPGPPGASRRITLLTDFGTRDGYVGAMKGVMAVLSPSAVFDDIAHDLPQGSIGDAAWALSRYWRLFPPRTVHLVVVDPGVGTARRALALEADARYVVAPDNGVASRVLEEADTWRAVSLEHPRERGEGTVSRTFHGRDVFAPAAARIAAGRSLDELGPPIEDPVRIREPAPKVTDQEIEGRVVAVDHFGNLITNVPADALGGSLKWTVVVSGRELELSGTYGDAAEGDFVALINSADRVEVAVRNGSAARRLEGASGLPVRLVKSEPQA